MKGWTGMFGYSVAYRFYYYYTDCLYTEKAAV